MATREHNTKPTNVSGLFHPIVTLRPHGTPDTRARTHRGEVTDHPRDSRKDQELRPVIVPNRLSTV